jgi:hypothetical protein
MQGAQNHYCREEAMICPRCIPATTGSEQILPPGEALSVDDAQPSI